MPPLLNEILWFLPWCWGVNMALNILGYITCRYSIRDIPLDLGARIFDTHRLLGNSTTYAGLLVCVALGLMGELALPGHHFFVLALLVYGGHALGSFIKRRLTLPEGTYLPFIDHGDYVLIIIIVSLLTGFLSLPAAVLGYFITILLTPFVTWIGFSVGIRTQKL